MAARAPRAIAFPAPGPATGNQTPDPGELPPILSFVPTPAYPFGTPTIQVMAGNIYRFGCDTIVVPTTERMDRAIYGPFPRKFHTNAGQNLESYNRVVHYAQAGANAAGLGGLPGASLLQPESVALRSPGKRFFFSYN
jgi:hypothetical protein